MPAGARHHASNRPDLESFRHAEAGATDPVVSWPGPKGTRLGGSKLGSHQARTAEAARRLERPGSTRALAQEHRLAAGRGPARSSPSPKRRTVERPSSRTGQCPQRQSRSGWDALMSFPSPTAHTARESHGVDGDASPTSLRPQVFATSRRLAPSRAFRVCFAPVTLLGLLPFRGFSPPDAEHLSAGRAPLDVAPERAAFRGLSVHADPCSHPGAGQGARAADPLLGFILSRAFSPLATAHALHAASPHALSTEPARRRARPGAPGSPSTKRVGLPLSSAAGPPEVHVLVSMLAASNSGGAGLMVSPRAPYGVSTAGGPSMAPRIESSQRAASKECRTWLTATSLSPRRRISTDSGRKRGSSDESSSPLWFQ